MTREEACLSKKLLQRRITMLTIGDLIEGFKKGFELIKKIFEFFKPIFGKDDDETSENA